MTDVVAGKVFEFNMLINKFNYTPISRETVDGKRHYCLPDGSKVPSVTTILDRTAPAEKKQALQNWRNRVGVVKAQEITTEAAGRGVVHWPPRTAGEGNQHAYRGVQADCHSGDGVTQHLGLCLQL